MKKVILMVLAIVLMVAMVGTYASIKNYELVDCTVVEVEEHETYTEVVVEYNNNLYACSVNPALANYEDNIAKVLFFVNDVDNVEDDEIIFIC